MKNFASFLAIGLFAAVFNMGCGGGGNSSTEAAKDSNNAKMDSNRTDTSGAAKTSTVPPTVSKSDMDFVVNAADAGMTEVQAGNLAEQKGVSADVKKFGEMMIKDHTEANDKLKAIAAKKNITIPSSISPDMQKSIDNLQKKNGKDFDKAYTDMMVSDHKKVISAFENESKNGSDADIRAFADSTLHTLRHHLDEAQKCKKMLSKM
jgi:putative membrane protein